MRQCFGIKRVQLNIYYPFIFQRVNCTLNGKCFMFCWYIEFMITTERMAFESCSSYQARVNRLLYIARLYTNIGQIIKMACIFNETIFFFILFDGINTDEEQQSVDQSDEHTSHGGDMAKTERNYFVMKFQKIQLISDTARQRQLIAFEFERILFCFEWNGIDASCK